METRSKKRKRQRLISIASYVSSWPDLPARFESLNDDTLGLILKFVGNKSYGSFGGLNYHCKEIYIASGMTKETFIFGYGPLSVIQERYERDGELDWKLRKALSKGVVFYNRRDVLEWALEEQNTKILRGICEVATEEGRMDLLNEIWDNFEDDEDYAYERECMIFGCVDSNAAESGKLDVIKWFDKKDLGNLDNIDKSVCAKEAARHGHLHILQWLKEEKDLQLVSSFYDFAIDGGQLHVMKWLREQSCPWGEDTFACAALEGHLDILQFLHDEGCPWDRSIYIDEEDVTSEVIEWLRINGYDDRIMF